MLNLASHSAFVTVIPIITKYFSVFNSMITSTLSFAVHMLMSSYRILAPVVQVLGYVLPQRSIKSAKAVMGKINVNTKHLGKGDPLPAYNGKLRIYNMRFCPYAQRTILALNAKEIDYEVVNINLMDKPDWLTSKSPLGKVPSIEVAEGVCIYESLVTVEYLDEAYPQRPLLPKDPLQRAYDKIIIEAASPIYTMYFKIMKAPDSITLDNINAYHSSLEYVQGQLKSRGTKFLGGNQPGYADYMVWPWFERLLECQKFDDRAQIDAQKYKLLVQYLENMLQDPAVSQYLVPSEAFRNIFNKYRDGQPPNYDLLHD